jgi:uncharacterized protein YggT (Ycf19 family)|tara:strand:+ start:27 stop:368 length:342 start_codon:yes stop_codon:yes gene_type:complete
MPLWILIIDYLLGIVMYTLIGRAAMNIFQREDSNFFFMKVFVKATNPFIKLFALITPSFLAKPIIPLYVAFYFYLIRFYLMPWLLGYGSMGMLSFPIDADFSRELYRLFSPDK